MNKKGFTLIELLAVIIILGIIATIAVFGLSKAFNSAKEKTEDAFIGTIKDAMEIYLASDAKELTFSLECSNTLSKSFANRKVYKVTTTFDSVINSEYRPITQGDLVNPANEDVNCNVASNIAINIYRDEDFVYYYSIDKDEFGCLTKSGTITNLPKGFSC